MLLLLLLLLLLNVKINVALSENASRTRYTIKIKLKPRKWVLKKKCFQLSFRWKWAGWSDNGQQTVPHARSCNSKYPVADGVQSGLWYNEPLTKIAVALPTHQSSASCWRGTEVPRYVSNGKLEQPVEIGYVQGSGASACLKAKVWHGHTSMLYKQDAPQHSARTEDGSSSNQECPPRSFRHSRVVSWSAQ